jgi:ABC-type branched-subunit amino acid transport system ATPase component
MTEPAGLSVPQDLLRASAPPAGRPRGHRERIDTALRGLVVVSAGCVMCPPLALVAVPAAVVFGRQLVRTIPFALVRSAVVRGVGAIVGGLVAGLVAASAVNEAQGRGFTAAAGLVLVLIGIALIVAADRTQVRDQPATDRSPSSAALDVHDLDFAYGAQQVLFGVSLTIAEGEIAALLGTNGAGKSTILRAVAGLDAPVAGSIELFGEDTTYADAQDIVHKGVALLAGGRMTFPSLTVDENLRVGAFTLKDTSAIDEVYRRFPALAPRRQQRAGTLSGGEQQMLALGRVLLTRPRLLLIDELTLGLAPKVVEQLIDIVREVNASGTTVLLVEQSANLALALADHSFFLERGEVRFDGPTAELLQRDDLLRPVFLTDVAP